MQRQVLDYLYAQGELVFAVFPGSPAPCEALEKFALALNAGASFVVFDFSQKREGNTGIPLKDLFTRILNNDELQSLEGAKQAGLVFAGFGTLDITEEHFRTFYHNLQLIKKMVPHTVGILPGDDPTALDEKILDIAKIVLVGGNSTDEAAAFIEDCAPLRKKNILWLLEKMPESA